MLGLAEVPALVLTVGHSTRPVEEFLELLVAHGVAQLVDIRSIPRSRHNPQYDRTRLPRSLETAGIHYMHMPGLGGRRRAATDSINTAWRNPGFRGYADYMQTAEFAESLADLVRDRDGTADGDHVRGSSAVAVPSLAGERRARRAGPSRGGDRECRDDASAHVDSVGPGAGHRGHLSVRLRPPQIELALAPRSPDSRDEQEAVSQPR